MLVDSVGCLRGIGFLIDRAFVGALECRKAAKSAHFGKLTQRLVLVARVDLHRKNVLHSYVANEGAEVNLDIF